MPALVIARPHGTPFTPLLQHLVRALQREHGYQVLLVEAHPDPLLSRLGGQHMFIAWERIEAAAQPRPLVVRLRRQGLAQVPLAFDIELTHVPLRLIPPTQQLLYRCQLSLFALASDYQAGGDLAGPQRGSSQLHHFVRLAA